MEQGNSRDIRHFIMSYLQRESSQSDDIDEGLLAEIAERSKGIFLWVVLVVRALQVAQDEGRTRGQMSEILRSTPTTLHDLFVQILATQKEEDREDAATLLQFLLFAPDNNDLKSLHHALAFALESPPVSLDQWQRSQDYSSPEMFKKRVRDLSCGLVEVVDNAARQQSRVQFIHETTRTFFSENNYMRLREMLASSTDSIVGRSHLKIMKSCLSYMATKEAISIALQTTCDYSFTQSETPSPRVYVNPIKFPRQALKRQAHAHLPFLNYAVDYLHKHVQATDSYLPWEGQSILIRRFEDNHRELFKTWKILRLSFREPGEPVRNEDSPMAMDTSLLEFAAHQGMKHCLPRLLRREEDPANMLLRAISKGQYDVVKSLINEGASIDAACDAFGKSALFYADDIRMTQLLVCEGADVMHIPEMVQYSCIMSSVIYSILGAAEL
jgi:hypothetical protein